jgi:C4-dicarboxylate transporter
MKHRIIAFGLIIATALAGFAPTAARAGEKQAKNAAIAATVATAFLLGSKKTRTAGIVGAAGSAYLWKKYADSRQARRKREQAQLNYYRRLAAQNARARSHRRAHR